MFITSNTKWPVIASSMFELAAYFEMAFLKILPSAQEVNLVTYIFLFVCFYMYVHAEHL